MIQQSDTHSEPYKRRRKRNREKDTDGRSDIELCFYLGGCNDETNPTIIGKLRVKTSKAFAAGADAVAKWSLWEQLDLADEGHYRKLPVEVTNSTNCHFNEHTIIRDHFLDQLHDSKISGGHFAFQKTPDGTSQRF